MWGATMAEVVNIASAPKGPIVLENNLYPTGVPLSNNLAYISTPANTQGLTVGALPTCSAANVHQTFDVTDCDSCIFGKTCVHTTGSTFCREVCNGSAWVVQ
jgi:hypothetical protein